ncbi:hypothetical protein Tco_0500998 [Tanacetum coccineum]
MVPLGGLFVDEGGAPDPLAAASGKGGGYTNVYYERVAPFGTDTLTALLAQHPILPLTLCLVHCPQREPTPLVVGVDNVLGCIQSFPKGTSCGRDGLRAQHILDALCGEGSAIAVGLLKAISVVVNLLLEGRCPKVLAGLYDGHRAPHSRCYKTDNVIRPIAVVAIWKGHRVLLEQMSTSPVYGTLNRSPFSPLHLHGPYAKLAWVSERAKLFIGEGDHFYFDNGLREGDRAIVVVGVLFVGDNPMWRIASLPISDLVVGFYVRLRMYLLNVLCIERAPSWSLHDHNFREVY